MSTATAQKPAAGGPAGKESQPFTAAERRFKARYAMLAILAVWVVGWFLLQGKQTLAMGLADVDDFHEWLNSVRDAFDSSRATNPFFQFVGAISTGLNWLISTLQDTFSQAPAGRPVPQIGWLGTFAILSWVAYAAAGVRSALLVMASVIAFGLFGYWPESMDLIIVTLISVVLCVIIGVPLGTGWRNRRSSPRSSRRCSTSCRPCRRSPI